MSSRSDHTKMANGLQPNTWKKRVAKPCLPCLSTSQVRRANTTEPRPQVTMAKVGVHSFLLSGQP